CKRATPVAASLSDARALRIAEAATEGRAWVISRPDYERLTPQQQTTSDYGDGGASSSSDIGMTPGIAPGEASNTPGLLAGCMAACTWKVRFLSPRITVIGTVSPAVM